MTKRKRPATVTLDDDLYNQAIADLDITKPVYTCRVVGDRLEFRLYGGEVLYWPPEGGPRVVAPVPKGD